MASPAATGVAEVSSSIGDAQATNIGRVALVKCFRVGYRRMWRWHGLHLRNPHKSTKNTVVLPLPPRPFFFPLREWDSCAVRITKGTSLSHFGRFGFCLRLPSRYISLTST
jgi:hypothetical protein